MAQQDDDDYAHTHTHTHKNYLILDWTKRILITPASERKNENVFFFTVENFRLLIKMICFFPYLFRKHLQYIKICNPIQVKGFKMLVGVGVTPIKNAHLKNKFFIINFKKCCIVNAIFFIL